MKQTLLLLVVSSILMISCSANRKQEYEFSYTFDKDQQDWSAGFVDLPADHDPDFYALDFGWGELPSGLEGSAIYLSGNNHSDDLFMFIQKEITGLEPETTYQVVFDIELASNIPEGLVGIGGSPGESVYVKAGAVDGEPEIVTDADNWLRLNIDKGNQASQGEDMIVLGTFANPNLDPETATGKEYALLNLNNQGVPFRVTSSEDGSIWAMIGTDSCFEGPTTIYYDSVDIALVKAD